MLIASLPKRNKVDPHQAANDSAFAPSTTAVLLGGIVVLATVVRLIHLGSLSFWLDESASVKFAKLSWPTFVDTMVHHEVNMTLYYFLLRPWLVLGSSEFVVRSLSVIFSVATIPVLYALGARMFSVRVGLVAGLLMALNAFHVQYAQEARGYSLLALLVTIAFLGYVVSVERPSRKSWISYAAASALAVYSHVFGVFVLPAQWASLIFLRPREIPWKSLLASVLLIGVLLLPFGGFLAAADRQSLARTNWIPKPKVDAVFRALVYISGAGSAAEKKVWRTSEELERRVLLLVYLVLCAIALTRVRKSWRRQWHSFEAWHYGLILSWLFVPLVLAFAISLIKPIWLPQYFVISLPPLMLLLAIGLSTIERQWASLAVLAVVVSLAAYQVGFYYRYASKEDWRGAAGYVLAQARPGDAIVFGKVARTPFTVYSDRMTGSATPPREIPFYDADEFRGDYRRIWMVVREGEPYLRSFPGRPLAHTEKFDGVEILLYAAR